jgi:hypothetical protein
MRMHVIVASPLRLRLPNGEVSLNPGGLETVDLTDEQVTMLITRVPDVQVLRVGSTVRWNSPLFGQCEGRVGMLPEDGLMGIEAHPHTSGPVLLPLSWITAIVADEPHMTAEEGV